MINQATLTMQTVDFGTKGVLTGNVDATGQISVTYMRLEQRVDRNRSNIQTYGGTQDVQSGLYRDSA